MRAILALLFVVLAMTGVAAVAMMPTDADHAATTTPGMLAEFADPPGQGPLDGVRYETRMGPEGGGPTLEDFIQFDRGLFMSRECTDRCNYPPSAYFSRATDTGHSFIVEAFCPVKDTTMVWRGQIEDGRISGTVAWTTNRFYWSRTQVLTFKGEISQVAADLSVTE